MEPSSGTKRTTYLQTLRQSLALSSHRGVLLFDSDLHCESDCHPSYRLLSIITQFPCSAGYVLVTDERLILWVDARYHLSALRQLTIAADKRDEKGGDGTMAGSSGARRENGGREAERGEGGGVVQVRLYQSEELWLIDLVEVLQADEKTSEQEQQQEILLPRATTSQATYLRWQRSLAARQQPITLRCIDDDLRGMIEKADKHVEASGEVWLLDDIVGAEVRAERIAQLKGRLSQQGLEYFTHNGADDINWILGIRGSDIPYNQIVLCYVLLTPHALTLYPSPSPLPDAVTKALAAHGVNIAPYRRYREDLRAIPDGVRIGVVAERVRRDIYEALEHKRMQVQEVDIPPQRYIKSEEEITHTRRALVDEGVAMVRLWAHIRRTLQNRERLTEADAYRLQQEYRGAADGYLWESFPAIIAYQEHGAEIHYNRARHSDTVVEPRGVLLIDCGGHYRHGTTDITRVFACGEVTREQIEDYTAVLRAHIALATARIPEGSSGTSLDFYARIPLWRTGRDYRHGTGHGVGWCLNVHDGPYALTPRLGQQPLQPNMLFSNEPGVYRAGKHGVRLESLIRIIPLDPTPTSPPPPFPMTFLACETLSVCPFDRKLIAPPLLSSEERHWLNTYHQRVAAALAPHLPPELQQWLIEQTAPI